MKQIGFIVGTGRCGTTILSQALNSHSKICVPHELQIMVSINNGDRLYDKYINGEFDYYKAKHFIRLIEKCCPYRFEEYFNYKKHFYNLDYPQSDLRTILTELFDHMCYEFNKDVFIEQTPWNGQRLDILQQLFPEMKVIHIVRDGRDVALSYARTPWWSTDLTENISRWAKEVDRIQQFGKNFPNNFIELRYEDLVTNPLDGLEAILKIFELNLEPEMLDPERSIDYLSFFKGNGKSYQSKEWNKWEEKKKKLFFSENIFAWKKKHSSTFSQLPQTVKDILSSYQYET